MNENFVVCLCFCLLVALTPEMYRIHGELFVLSLEGRREQNFLWLFSSASLFFPLLLSFLGEG